MKKYRVYTYFHPSDDRHRKSLCLAYFREQTPGAITYEVEAPNSYDAKRQAIILRRAHETAQQGREGGK